MRTDAHLLKVSRGFEYEADMYAFQHASDYNITWETCYDLFSSIPSGNVSDKMSTHPMTSKRQTQCVEYIKSGKEAYSPDYETLRETTPELITF
jgi:Zn-dependent protease with chaperone function